MRVRPLAAVVLSAAALTLAACSSDGTTPEDLAKITQEPPRMVNVQAKGATSPECSRMREMVTNVTTIALKADGGIVEQTDFDRAFSASAVTGIPADAMVYVDAIKPIAQELVGKDVAAATEVMTKWTHPFTDLTNASIQICR
ncbi:MAG TPA: hypothetical protein PLX71_03335 [Phycicoccus sp.]|nr:hypothetical protein [Phycicoccus sp.]